MNGRRAKQCRIFARVLCKDDPDEEKGYYGIRRHWSSMQVVGPHLGRVERSLKRAWRLSSRTMSWPRFMATVLSMQTVNGAGKSAKAAS